MKIVTLVVLTSLMLFAQPKQEKTNSAAGAFARMGFGARGIAMGNAFSAVKTGNLSSYYNPAVNVFQQDNYAAIGYTLLDQDRSLNNLVFTRRFDFYAKDDTTENRKPRSTAGVSAGIINAGVSNIDGRDNQGLSTGELSTSENQFFVSFANKFSQKISAGVAVKFYYYSLYKEVTSNSVGFDIGVLYTYSENLTFSFVLQDINSKYKWDTGPLFGNQGTSTTDNFPLAKKIGFAWNSKDLPLLVTGEIELNNYERRLLRFGAEYVIIPELTLRGGIDKLHLYNRDEAIVPSLGFLYNVQLSGQTLGIEYAAAPEQFSGSLRQILGITFNF